MVRPVPRLPAGGVLSGRPPRGFQWGLAPPALKFKIPLDSGIASGSRFSEKQLVILHGMQIFCLRPNDGFLCA